MPLEAGRPREDYVNRLRAQSLWFYLPMPELRKECKEWGIDLNQARLHGDDSEQRQQMANLLLFSLNGVPVNRFDSMDAAAELAQQSVALQDMNVEEMNKQCKEWNLPTFPKD